MLLLPFMRIPEKASKEDIEESLGDILKLALKDPSFSMIFVANNCLSSRSAFISNLSSGNCSPLLFKAHSLKR